MKKGTRFWLPLGLALEKELKAADREDRLTNKGVTFPWPAKELEIFLAPIRGSIFPQAFADGILYGIEGVSFVAPALFLPVSPALSGITSRAGPRKFSWFSGFKLFMNIRENKRAGEGS